MLLTITTTHSPATDLGYLLHKNPAECQRFGLTFGEAYVFYPEASIERCTVALMLQIDPVGLVRNRRLPGGERGTLQQYVNDRPYTASSFMSVAIAQVFGSALAGRSRERPDLAQQPLPLAATMAAVPCRGGEPVLRRLFESLGYTVSACRHPLDEQFPDWGESRYFAVGLQGCLRLRDLLSHLYVLVPVLDDDKHYWVGDDEVEKLLRHGAGWLAQHPDRELITQRYLKHQRSLAQSAVARLSEVVDSDTDETAATHAEEEAMVERPLRLNEQRLGVVLAVVKQSGARRVLDLGCGEGRLLRSLLEDRTFEEIVGMDVTYRSLEIAQERLRLDRMPPLQRQRIRLIHGSLNYRDRRLEGYDAATVVEVIEHLDPPRLAAFERTLFGCARPGTVVVTTPNAEYNAKFASLPAGQMRHKDHRFEWTRAQFREWADRVAARFDYSVRYLAVGPEDDVLGSPTQMAVFTLKTTAD
jgi:3' terminal RNA ribose 2'-O-methyltransferase Hen1